MEVIFNCMILVADTNSSKWALLQNVRKDTLGAAMLGETDMPLILVFQPRRLTSAVIHLYLGTPNK